MQPNNTGDSADIQLNKLKEAKDCNYKSCIVVIAML